MTTKIDGTNGVLQSYDYQVLTTGFSYTFASGITTLVINPAGTLATGTITMPASPADGMVITFSSTRQVTALTVAGNTGQSIVSAPTVLPANQAAAYMYRLTNTTWLPIDSVPTNVPVTGGGSTITSGTTVASTSGTLIDFTGIPSWAKRVTVMFNAVSLSGTSDILVQLGTSGGIDATGYSGSGIFLSTSGSGRTATTGYLVYLSSAARVFIGSMVITSMNGNLWVEQTTGSDSTTNAIVGGGVKTLSAVLTQLRITTVNGTDTFDAGSINILYE